MESHLASYGLTLNFKSKETGLARVWDRSVWCQLDKSDKCLQIMCMCEVVDYSLTQTKKVCLSLISYVPIQVFSPTLLWFLVYYYYLFNKSRIEIRILKINSRLSILLVIEVAIHKTSWIIPLPESKRTQSPIGIWWLMTLIDLREKDESTQPPF